MARLTQEQKNRKTLHLLAYALHNYKMSKVDKVEQLFNIYTDEYKLALTNIQDKNIESAYQNIVETAKKRGAFFNFDGAFDSTKLSDKDVQIILASGVNQINEASNVLKSCSEDCVLGLIAWYWLDGWKFIDAHEKVIKYVGNDNFNKCRKFIEDYEDKIYATKQFKKANPDWRTKAENDFYDLKISSWLVDPDTKKVDVKSAEKFGMNFRQTVDACVKEINEIRSSKFVNTNINVLNSNGEICFTNKDVEAALKKLGKYSGVAYNYKNSDIYEDCAVLVFNYIDTVITGDSDCTFREKITYECKVEINDCDKLLGETNYLVDLLDIAFTGKPSQSIESSVYRWAGNREKYYSCSFEKLLNTLKE